MFFKCFKFLRTTFGPNWAWGIEWNKYTTNPRWFGGHGSTWGSPWSKMISFNKMTSTISTRSINKQVGNCMPTLSFQFKLGHIIIRMTRFFLRSKRYWWDSSAIHHWDANTHPIGINVHMGAQGGNFNGCSFWQ
jgi:hypothetical protein